MYTRAYIGFDCLLFVLNSEQVTFTKYVLTLIKGNELMFECIHLMDTIQTYVGFSLRFFIYNFISCKDSNKDELFDKSKYFIFMKFVLKKLHMYFSF